MAVCVGVPGQVRRTNPFQVLYEQGAAAARAGLSRDAGKLRGFERMCWLDGFDSAVRGVSDNVRQKVSDNVRQVDGRQ